MDPHTSKSTSNIKRFSAVIGGSAVVAMGALGIAIGQGHGVDAVAKSSQMTVGATSTETTPSTLPGKGMVAKPTIKGPAPLPSEEAAAK